MFTSSGKRRVFTITADVKRWFYESIERLLSITSGYHITIHHHPPPLNSHSLPWWWWLQYRLVHTQHTLYTFSTQHWGRDHPRQGSLIFLTRRTGSKHQSLNKSYIIPKKHLIHNNTLHITFHMSHKIFS